MVELAVSMKDEIVVVKALVVDSAAVYDTPGTMLQLTLIELKPTLIK